MPLLVFNLEDRSPFDQTLVLSKGATLPELEVQLLDGSSPEVLTGGTVTFSMDDDQGVAKITNKAALLVDGPTGKIKYVWVAADVDTEGNFVGQFKVVVGSVQYLVPNNEDQRLRIVVGPAV